MSFSPCFIIPVYNHGDTVGATVGALAAHGLPIYLVDDGSDSATAQILNEIASKQQLARLVRRTTNGGKGAAVMDGMHCAASEGCSHALQVDADGQHTLEDVGRFFAASRKQPEKIICGVPHYDASVPKGRLYGRYITHFWVWIETLSFDIRDSMCGFRVYPLPPTCDLIEKVAIGRRMDFDTEILVRLYWRGVEVVNLETRVIYPVGGISHFQLWRDNIRISWMHTRLVFGMLARLPWLLTRRWQRTMSA